MRFLFAAAVLTCAAIPAIPVAGQAPTWSPEQQAVWAVVEQSWKDEMARNGKWPGSYTDPNMTAWGPEWPMPRNAASLERWTRFQDKQGKSLEYEITPMAIAISGNTAVVNYASVNMWQREVPRGETPPKPDRDMTALTETLVRTATGWKFLGSTSFSLDDD